MRVMNYEMLCGQSILLLGKTRALNLAEFDTLLKLHKIERIDSYKDEIALIIEGRMMNPYEEGESLRLYEMQKIPIVSLEGVEKWLCQSIEPDRLLMSLKLSRNQERLVNFLQNPYITDELFFKLLKLYDWQGEGLFDNDTNRDVTAAIIGRFYVDLDRNHNVQYAMSGMAHLIERYGNRDLINTIAELTPIAKELKNPTDRSLIGVLDALALHSDTDKTILAQLINTRAELLAHREPLTLESELLSLENEAVNRVLSLNKTLSPKGADTLEKSYPQLIAGNVFLSDERFDRLKEGYARYLATNFTLTTVMQNHLSTCVDEEVLQALASNRVTEPTLLNQFFESGRFKAALASNPSLPSDKLEMLYASGESEVLSALARNIATPVEILYQLSLDQRFERLVKTNPTFGKHIQTHNIGWL